MTPQLDNPAIRQIHNPAFPIMQTNSISINLYYLRTDSFNVAISCFRCLQVLQESVSFFSLTFRFWGRFGTKFAQPLLAIDPSRVITKLDLS